MTSDTSDVNKTVVFADPPGTNNFVSATVPIGLLNADMMDVAFTKAVGCTQYPGGCDGMRKDHRFADAVPLGENWRHKYLIDIDGMGYSARLFSLVCLLFCVQAMPLMLLSSSPSQQSSNLPSTPSFAPNGCSHGSITSQFRKCTKRSTTSMPTSPDPRKRCLRPPMLREVINQLA